VQIIRTSLATAGTKSAESTVKQTHNNKFAFTSHIHYVNSPTHRCGGTLDLLMTFSDRPLRQVSVDPTGILSEHSLVTCPVPVTVGQEDVAERTVRGWRRIDRDVLRSALQATPLSHPVSQNADVDELFAVYNSVLREITTSQHPPSLCSSSTVVRRQVSPGSQGLSSAGAPLLTHEDRRWSSSLGSSCPGPVLAVQNCEAGILARPASQYGRSSAPVWRSLSSLLGRRRDVTAPNNYTA